MIGLPGETQDTVQKTLDYLRNDSEVKMVWMDGGIRPSHPDIITDADDIGDNGVLLIGDNGLINASEYGNSAWLYIKGQEGVVASV